MSEGYYQTPVKMIPLNDREPGEIADIAKQQLKRFQQAADGWPIYKIMRDKRKCNICRMCDENLWFEEDTQEQPYQYTTEEIRSLIVAHVRQCHANIVDEDGIISDRQDRISQVVDLSRHRCADSSDSNNADRSVHQNSNTRGE